MRIQPNRALVNGLIAGIAVLMVAGIAGAVVKPGAENVRAGDKAADAAAKKKEGGEAGFVDPTASSVPDNSTATTAAGAKSSGGGTTPASGGKKSTVAAPGPGAPNPAATLTAPKAGIYQYQSDGEDPQSLTVATDSTSGGETRQTISGSAAFGSGKVHTAWNSQGYRWERIEASGKGQSGSCDFTPPLQLMAQPLKVGAQWKFDSRCTFQAGGASIELHFYGTVNVTGVDRVKVGDKLADVWVLQRDMNVDYSYGGKTNPNNVKSEERFAPAYGLEVETKDTYKAQDGSTQTKTKRLLNLDSK